MRSMPSAFRAQHVFGMTGSFAGLDAGPVTERTIETAKEAQPLSQPRLVGIAPTG
jgi:hypothetical protein